MAGLVGTLGQAHVGQLSHAGQGHEDIVRLDVAVNDVARVGVFQSVRDVQDDVDRIAYRQPLEPLQQLQGA